MKLLTRLLLLAGLIALAVWFWGFFFPAPQKIIEKKLLKLARLVSFSSADGNLKKIADAERISSLLAENIHVVLDLPGNRSHTFDNREELLQALLAARATVKTLRVEFTDINITVNPNHQSAESVLTVKAKIAGEPDPVVAELKFTFTKTKDDWLVTGLETIKSLR